MDNCEFCDREKELTFHHYIPRTVHTNKWFKKNFKLSYMKTHGTHLCDDCHKTVHTFFTEKELGRYFNTKQKLFSNEKFYKFLKWVKKQR